MFGLKGIHHLAMATRDMEGTIRFWRDLLGMRLVGGLGKKGYKLYFFEISAQNYIVFFEWPDVKPVEEKDHGMPASGPWSLTTCLLPWKTSISLCTAGDPQGGRILGFRCYGSRHHLLDLLLRPQRNSDRIQLFGPWYRPWRHPGACRYRARPGCARGPRTRGGSLAKARGKGLVGGEAGQARAARDGSPIPPPVKPLQVNGPPPDCLVFPGEGQELVDGSKKNWFE